MTYWTENDSSSDEDDVDQSLSVDALVVRAQGGDQRAFEALYTRYKDQLTSYLSHRVGNAGVGRELTQEAFLKVWSALPKLRTPTLFVSWLYRIALNCAYDYQRHLRHMQLVPLEICMGNGEIPSVEGPEGEFEDTELLRLALAHVSPLYRTCLILYVIEEMPQRQIAERLNIKGSNVSKYVSRGKEELRQIYGQLLRGQSTIQATGRNG